MDKLIFEKSPIKVLLIGVSNYKDDASINSIPNAKRNITLLKKAFISNKVLNITEKDITVSLNETKTEIERTLINAARDAENQNYTLLVYYSGHGIISNENFNLYLTATNSTYNYLESDAINVERFKEIIDSSKAGRKIVILDSCHSGAIHGINNNSTQVQNELNKISGTYVISSTSRNDSALFPIDNPKEPTYFTGKFIEILNKGIENNKSELTIRDIFEEIETSFSENGLPLPQQSIFQNADKIVFAENNFVVESKNETVNTELALNNVTFCNVNEKPKAKRFNLLNRVASVML